MFWNTSRRIANEDDVIRALGTFADSYGYRVKLHEAKDDSGDVPVGLFSAAAAIVGPHGAGLTHALFAPKGTVIIEFVFMRSPPMMFRHIAEALGMQYAMSPLPHSYWAQREKKADPHEVVALLERALGINESSYSTGCPLGSQSDSEGGCAACPQGTYRASLEREECAKCLEGRVSGNVGQAFCENCDEESVPDPTQTHCLPCPPGEVAAATPIRCGSPSLMARLLASR